MFQGRRIIGLMACDPNGVIGKEGKLPWSYPEEMEHFRRTTFGQIMIMGRKTYEATPPSTLKDRYNIIFSTHINLSVRSSNTIPVHSLEEFRQLSLPKDKKIFMIGGNEIAKLFLTANLIEEFLLTKIHQTYEGDTYFSLHLLEGWSSSLIRKEKEFSIYQFIKKVKPVKPHEFYFGC